MHTKQEQTSAPGETMPAPAEIPTGEALDAVLEALGSGNFEASAEGQPVTIHGELGRGGAKTVYDATVAGESVALGLPNPTGGPAEVLKKWNMALQEPAATDKVRALGLLTNPVCRVQEVEIASTAFPAIAMTRFADLPYDVKDGKNPGSSISRELFESGSLHGQWFSEKALNSLGADCATLIKAGAKLKKDSFSTCVTPDGELRLFVHDLGDAAFEPIEGHGIDTYAQGYARFALGSFINGVSVPEYQGNREFFDQLQDDMFDMTGLYEALVNQIRQAAEPAAV